MTAVTSSSRVSTAVAALRTQTGFVLMATAGVGVLMGAHWRPLSAVMAIVCLVTLLAPTLARRSLVWMAVAALWGAAVVFNRSVMEDHVYLYLAWIVAIVVSLRDHASFVDEIGQHGRRLLVVVFGFATFWKLASGSFISGSVLWVFGLLDGRLGPLLRLLGISAESLDAARPAVVAVGRGDSAGYDIELSTYSTVALVAVSIGTLLIEAAVGLTHAVRDGALLARLRLPALVIFGTATYAVVPVLPFALLLALIGCTIAGFERNAKIALGMMVLVTIARLATL